MERSLELRRPGIGLSLAAAALVIYWLLLFFILSSEWGINPQYNYGYVVPLLSAALLWQRWPQRPVARVPNRTAAVGVLSLGFLFLYLPLRLILEANPEWRVLYWIQALQMIGLSGCLLYYCGGWPWVRHFCPPLALTLTAVPWPMQLEQGAVQNLMRFVAGLTVAMADALGIAAVQHGNLVEVSAGVVGIDEACSGVRSLQSAFMISLFLGALYRFSALRRLSLFRVQFYSCWSLMWPGRPCSFGSLTRRASTRWSPGTIRRAFSSWPSR
jgi:exosortase